MKMENLLFHIDDYFECNPFVKWVGGKSQISQNLSNYLPKSFNNYYEIFLGSGAFFFHLNNNKILGNKKIFINDINKALINSYLQIKNNARQLIDKLEELQLNHNKENYYLIRELFNKNIENDNYDINQAAFFIYLNKTCFNGLYRENSKGLFNVPIGSYVNPKIYIEKNIINLSKALKNVEISNKNYDYFTDVSKNDFLYLDPPYYPISKTSSFTKYNRSDFLDKEQQELKEYLDFLNSKGAFFMLSNSYCDFNLELYKDYEIDIIYVNRFINSDITKRGKIKEIIVKNY